MLFTHKVRCCFPHAFRYHLRSGERTTESGIWASFLWASADEERWLCSQWLLVPCFSASWKLLSMRTELRNSNFAVKERCETGLYICLPPSFPFPVTPVAAFLQHDRRELTHCSTGHDCLLFSNLGPQSKVHQLGALFAASCGMAARAAGGLQDLLPVTLQLHPRTSVCLVTFRRDCVSAHMRLRIHRHASVETCLLSCSSLPQNVASLVRAHLESALVSPAGGPQALPVP